MKRYFCGLLKLSGLKPAVLPGVVLLLGAVLFAAAPLSARAEAVPELVIKGDQVERRNPETAGGGLLDLNDYVGDAICYREDAAFILPCPGGWTGDPAAAGRLDLCGIYYPQAYTFDTAPVVMYPRLVTPFPGKSLEERAQKQAEFTRDSFRKLPGGQNLTVRKEETYTAVNGRAFAIRFFDNGPPPNAAEAAAYTIHNDSMLIVVLSAKSAKDLKPYLPTLYTALDEVAAMNCVIEK